MARRHYIGLFFIPLILGAGWVSYGLATPSARSNHHAAEETANSVKWAVLAQARESGFTKDLQYVLRRYPDAVKKLADSEILIKGYIVTLQPTGRFSQFLLVPYPPSCPYCIPGGPAQTVQVHTNNKVGFSMQPVLVRGTLKLHEQDASGLLYTLEDAEIVS